MTEVQKSMVQNIKRYIEQNDMFNSSPDYEFKKFEVEETDYGTVMVYSVTGMKNDEGTAAAIFCRNIRQIFIGKRGGLRSSIWDSQKKKSVDLRGWLDVMIYGYSH